MIGQALGSYRVVQLLGQGGMGVVYVGEHAMLGNRVAIKLLLPEMSRNAEVVQRFFNEARAATLIKHPGIVQIFDFGRAPDGSAYFVMELLDGESLTSRMARARMPLDQIASVTRGLCSALAAAHDRGIVHRDLKPDNVFLVRDPDVAFGERPKILDFGIAKLATAESTSMARTRTGSVMGTPYYMSPEQCRGAGVVDGRSDVYSLGCILFEMLCGRPPFVGEGAGEIIGQHQFVEAPRAAALNPGIPPYVEAVVMRMLAKNPADRPQSMVAVAQEMEQAARQSSPAFGSQPQAVTPLGSQPPHLHSHPSGRPTTLSSAASQMSTGASRPRSKVPIIIGSVVGVALVAVLIAVLGRGGGTTGAPATNATTTTSANVAADPPAADPPAADPPAAPDPTPTSTSTSTPPADPAPPATAPPAPIVIQLTSTPSGAQVLRGSTVVGRTPFEETLDHSQGKLEYTVRLKGHHDARVSLRGDASASKAVRLKKKAKLDDETANPFGD